MKRREIIFIVIIGLLSILSSLLGSIATSLPLPPFVRPYLRFVWPAFAVVALLGIIFAVWQNLQEKHPALTPEKRKRRRMLEKVRAQWITGWLEPALQQRNPIVLSLHEEPSAVEQERFDQSERELLPSTCITQIYRDAARDLVILGEPGSGKTILLLELTRDLLEQVEQAKEDESLEMPVVFNLSSWKAHQKLSDWLVDVLVNDYQIPREWGQSWVNRGEISLLLDGLDEVDPGARTACIDAIKEYRKDHSVPTVVCSRRSEYLALPTSLPFKTVVIQPLTKEQIASYLSSASGQLTNVRATLYDDPDLQEMVETPLMLSILAEAYRDEPLDSLLVEGSLEERRRQVFATYVERMPRHRSINPQHRDTRLPYTTHLPYTPLQTKHWLTWLAQELERHSMPRFYIERIQPAWLLENRQQKLYRRITKLTAGLIIGFITAISLDVLIYQVVGGNHSGLVIGLITGLFVGLSIKPDTEIKPAERAAWSWMRIRLTLTRFLPLQLLSVRNVTSTFRSKWTSLLEIMLGLGLVGGIIGLIASIFTLHWQAQDIAGDLLSILTYILTFALMMAILAPLVIFLGLLLYYLIFLLAIAVNNSLISGFSSEMLDEKEFTKPNQGIWLSARNSLLVGLSSFLIVTMIEILVFWLFYRLVILLGGQFSCDSNSCNSGFEILLFLALPFALFFGLRAWLRNGGLACIEHVVLRLLFWRAGSMPLNYPRFLDYAAACIFLRKVGGGYSFVHPLLREYFASLEPASLGS